ncbi:hypothetical protein [Leuconostoc mesenteroides]|uniref:hypothetical protein n=1 Tax=Leuconostoc mesenteroides TaxID=1245 RepID=UPI0021A85C4A|nr:hypothetical protein [Leuconostoc mesenteroides]MCT3053648.1 hypothetical protein [Leuconostoc mesenteroides]
MVKYTVEQDFTDKLTHVVYRKGADYPSDEVSDERLSELLGNNHKFHDGALIVKIDDKPTDKNTVAEIKSYLDEHEIESDGVTKKQELLDLIK